MTEQTVLCIVSDNQLSYDTWFDGAYDTIIMVTQHYVLENMIHFLN